MKYIKLFENFELIKEDILELKQMSKQMYSYFKSKGFTVEIEEQLSPEKLKGLADKGMLKAIGTPGPTKKNAYQQMSTSKDGGTVQKIASNEMGQVPVKLNINEQNEVVTVAVPAYEVAKILKKEGKDIRENFVKNPDVVQYVNEIGEELSKMIKEKYPKMVYNFEIQYEYWFIMRFGYQTTSKGGYNK